MKKAWLSLAVAFVVVGVALVAMVGTSKAESTRTDGVQVVQQAQEVKPGAVAVAKKYCPDGWKVTNFKSSKDYFCEPKPIPKPAECKGPYWECIGCKCHCWPYEPPK